MIAQQSHIVGNSLVANRINKLCQLLRLKNICYELRFSDFEELSNLFPNNIIMTATQISIIAVDDKMKRDIRSFNKFKLNIMSNEDLITIWEETYDRI